MARHGRPRTASVRSVVATRSGCDAGAARPAMMRTRTTEPGWPRGAADRGGLQPLRRHASDPRRPAALSGHHALSEGRKLDPTGSLKHGWRGLYSSTLVQRVDRARHVRDRGVVGLDAVSEAYFARMGGCGSSRWCPPAPRRRSSMRSVSMAVKSIRSDDPRAIYEASHRLAAEPAGHFIDQFTYAERATDWRGNKQHRRIDLRANGGGRASGAVLGGVRRGTGGTSATIGRFIRYCRYDSEVLRCRPGAFGLPTAISRIDTVTPCPKDAVRGSKGSAAPASSRVSCRASSTV